jgi:hypothetical protein
LFAPVIKVTVMWIPFAPYGLGRLSTMLPAEINSNRGGDHACRLASAASSDAASVGSGCVVDLDVTYRVAGAGTQVAAPKLSDAL